MLLCFTNYKLEILQLVEEKIYNNTKGVKSTHVPTEE